MNVPEGCYPDYINLLGMILISFYFRTLYLLWMVYRQTLSFDGMDLSDGSSVVPVSWPAFAACCTFAVALESSSAVALEKIVHIALFLYDIQFSIITNPETSIGLADTFSFFMQLWCLTYPLNSSRCISTFNCFVHAAIAYRRLRVVSESHLSMMHVREIQAFNLRVYVLSLSCSLSL